MKNLQDHSDELHAKINTVEDEVLAELKAATEKILAKGSKKVAMAYKAWKKSLHWSMNTKDVVEEMARLDKDSEDWGLTSLRFLATGAFCEAANKVLGS